MQEKEKVVLVLFAFGIMMMSISALDVISIVSSILNHIVGLKLPDVFFSSIAFRIMLVLLGGFFILIAARMYKRMDCDLNKQISIS